MNKAEELIACLEGEIAKRDARIVELDKKYGWALSELAALKAQEPAFMWHKGATEDESEVVDVDCACPCCVPLYAAPVSEANEQGEYGDAYQGAREDLAIWKRRALEAEKALQEERIITERLGNALNEENGPTFMGEPVFPAKAKGVVMPEPMKRGDEGGSGEYGAAMIRGYNACLREVARLNAAPAATAADAGIVDMYRHLQKVTPYRFKKIQDASITDGGDVMYFHKDRFDAALLADMAAHCAAKGVV